MVRLQVIGGGRMGEALVAGLLVSGWANPDEITIVERLDERAELLRERFPGVDVRRDPVACEGAVIAVKPADVGRACVALSAAGVQRVLSIAAGVHTGTLEDELGGGIPIVRAMPNTPSLVRAGAAAIAPGMETNDHDLAWAEGILSAVGTVVRVKEAELDAVTGLSGSGPAYAFLVAESMVDAGVLAGLPRPVAEQLTFQTLLGAGRLLVESGDGPAALRAAVTSPGGTTAAGVRELEVGGVRAAVIAAVEAAADRSAELGA